MSKKFQNKIKKTVAVRYLFIRIGKSKMVRLLVLECSFIRERYFSCVYIRSFIGLIISWLN